MKSFEILNLRHKTHILNMLERQYGFSNLNHYRFFKTSRNRIYILNNTTFLDQFLRLCKILRLRIRSFGLYLGTLYDSGFRPSIEGSYIIGQKSYKNILVLNKKQAEEWLFGSNIELTTKQMKNLDTGVLFPILKFKDHFLGSGKLAQNIVLNHVPKARRVKAYKNIVLG